MGSQRFQRFLKDSRDFGEIPKIPERLQRNDTKFPKLILPSLKPTERDFYSLIVVFMIGYSNIGNANVVQF